MTGKQIQDAAVALARTMGYKAAHFRQAPARGPGTFITPYSYDTKGFPDLVLVSRSRKRMVVVEVKGKGDKLRTDQVIWLDYFSEAGIPTLVLDEKGWQDGALERLLA